MMPPESPCEGKGSFIRLLWDVRQGRISPGDLSDRVLLAQAGVRCCGAARDEMLVEEVARLYEEANCYRTNPAAPYERGGVGVEKRNVETPALASRGGGIRSSDEDEGHYAKAFPREEARPSEELTKFKGAVK